MIVINYLSSRSTCDFSLFCAFESCAKFFQVEQSCFSVAFFNKKLGCDTLWPICDAQIDRATQLEIEEFKIDWKDHSIWLCDSCKLGDDQRFLPEQSLLWLFFCYNNIIGSAQRFLLEQNWHRISLLRNINSLNRSWNMTVEFELKNKTKPKLMHREETEG